MRLAKNYTIVRLLYTVVIAYSLSLAPYAQAKMLSQAEIREIVVSDLKIFLAQKGLRLKDEEIEFVPRPNFLESKILNPAMESLLGPMLFLAKYMHNHKERYTGKSISDFFQSEWIDFKDVKFQYESVKYPEVTGEGMVGIASMNSVLTGYSTLKAVTYKSSNTPAWGRNVPSTSRVKLNTSFPAK